MAKNDNHKTAKRGLRDLFGKSSGDDTAELIAEASKPREEAELPPPPETDEGQFPVLEGSLLQVWRRWKEAAVPPLLSLRGKRGGELPLDKQAQMRERVRISARLEQDARNRLRALNEAAVNPEAPELEPLCCVYLSRDKMVAWMFIFPPSKPEAELKFEDIAKAMQDGGITTGINSEMVTHLYQNKAYFELTPVACGTMPVEGTDGSVLEHFPREVSKEVKVDENGVADYRSLNYVQMIEKDEVICDIIKPVAGMVGMRVDGTVVQPRAVKAAKVPRGSNTTLTEDGLHLVATRTGHLEYSDGFHVKPILEIKGDVDYSTGNIDYHGDVHVFGDVRENFTVRATGTIIIDGLVEAATVEAGGDLTITCGVLGDNRALIKSSGCIRAKYLENCVAYAGKCVFADCIISSQIYSDDEIKVLSGRGTVIGGALMAAHTIRARMIGSQSGRRTEITLGVFPYIEAELRDGEADLEAIAKETAELDKQLRYLEEQQGMEGGGEKLAKAHLRRSVLAMKAEKILKRQKKIQDMTPDLTRCRFECSVVYPVTLLTILDVTHRFDAVKNSCRASFDVEHGEINLF